jgi:DNA-binding MarR family transcriptional regulator
MVSFARSGPRDMGVTASLTLVTIDFCGPQRITELATMEGVSQPSMSGVVSGLERAGLVERKRDPQDRRVVLVGLTAQGQQYLQRRRESGVEMLARLIGSLPDSESEALLATLPILERLSVQAARQHLGMP